MQGYDALRLSTIAAGLLFCGLLIALVRCHTNPPSQEQFEAYP